MQLREYQVDLVNRTREAFRRSRRVCMQLSTGGGKTPTACHIVNAIYRSGKRVWFTVHKDFLLEQASEKLRLFGVPHGIVTSGHFPDPRHRVLICSIGTLRNRHPKMPPPDWIITDECHHAASPTWAELLNAYEDAYHLGLSATPERPDGQGLSPFYDELVCGATAAELMQWNREHPGEGLCPYRIVGGKIISAEAVRHNSKGEYRLDELGELMSDKKILGDAVAEYERLDTRPKFVTFAPTVDVSMKIESQYRERGHAVIHLDGKTDRKVIRQAIRDYATGQLRGITSRDILLEGLDLKGVGAVQWLRHSESLVVVSQGNGRGWRPDTDELIIMDHVGNLGQMVNGDWVPKHGLPDQPHPWSLEGKRARLAKEKPVPLWDCPKCRTSNQLAYSRCKSCDTPRPVRARKEIEVDASVTLEALDLDLIREQDARNRQEQSSARGVEALIAIGKSVGQAQHIEAARREKAYMRAQVREKATGLGDFDMLREYMRLKPKALKTYLEQMV